MKTYSAAAAAATMVLFLSLFFAVGINNAIAQDSTAAPSPTPENEEIKKLKDQIELLKLQSEKATLEKTINETQFPKPSTTPLAGDTTIDAGVKIETEMMAYRALSNASSSIAQDVAAKLEADCAGCEIRKVAILNSQWLTGLRGFWVAKNQLEIMRQGYKQIFNPPPPPRIVGIYNTIKPGLLAGVYRDMAKKNNGNIAGDFSKIDPTDLNWKSASGDKAFSLKTSAASFLEGANVITSVAGAALNLLALLRTDTKITGSTYTVQESAFVSQVYRELNKGSKNTLFYPIEFSPNINLQKEFVILKIIQDVSESRAGSERVVVGIEESEKGIKEATAAKNTLEERQKVLPDEITAVKTKMRELEKSFPNAAKRPRDVIIDLNDLETKLKALMKESGELSGKLKKTIAAIADLEAKRDALYSEIRQTPPPNLVINGYVDLSYELDAVSAKFLNRNFELDEVEGLALNLESVKKKLADQAKVRLRRELTDEEKKQLFNPVDAERLKIFVKLSKNIISGQIRLNDLEPAAFLTAAEQLKLIYPNNETAGVEGKIAERQKAASLLRLKVLNKQFDKFFEDAVKVDEKLGVSPIALYLQSESLLDALGCDFDGGNCAGAYALSLKVIDAGGNNRTKKNLWTMAIAGDNVSHSGGAIVEYKLYDMSGIVKTSSICRAYEAYRKPGNINKPRRGESGNAFCEAQPVALNRGNQ